MPNDENGAAGRQMMFKNKGRGTKEDMRRKRMEETVGLRKTKKDDQLLKRRNVDLNIGEISPLQERNKLPPVSMTLEEIQAGIVSDNEDMKVQATQAARRMLSQEKNPPIDIMIQAGIIPHCVRFLAQSTNSSLQFEAAWALTNIASGNATQTKAVVDAGAVPYLVKLLESGDQNVCEQAVWALGNIVGDGPEMRDYVIGCSAIQPLLNLLNNDTGWRPESDGEKETKTNNTKEQRKEKIEKKTEKSEKRKETNETKMDKQKKRCFSSNKAEFENFSKACEEMTQCLKGETENGDNYVLEMKSGPPWEWVKKKGKGRTKFQPPFS